jgi:aquaporin Z
MMKKYIAELVATFALVFCGTGAMIIDQEMHGVISHLGVAITWGLIVTAMIYAFGHVSGANMNPAVSIVLTLNKQLKFKDLLPYIGFQIIGAVAASIVLKCLLPSNVLLGATIPAGPEMQSFILELMLTFLLVLVVLLVSNGSDAQQKFAGIAVGAVVGLEALFAGPVCGASMNPTRSLAPAIVSGHIEHLWLYIIAPTTGALLAFVVYQFFKNKQA